MRFVVDASVAVKWLVVEEDTDVAQQLATGELDLHAPRLMASEVANALWSKARAGEIECRTARVILANVPDMPVRWGAPTRSSPPLLRAWRWRSTVRFAIASISRSRIASVRSC